MFKQKHIIFVKFTLFWERTKLRHEDTQRVCSVCDQNSGDMVNLVKEKTFIFLFADSYIAFVGLLNQNKKYRKSSLISKLRGKHF